MTQFPWVVSRSAGLRDQVNWDSVTGDYAISEIDEDSIRQFVRMAKDRLPYAQENEPAESILEKLQLLHDGKLTRGAVLLFGMNPQRYFPLAEIHMGRFKDSTTIADDKLLKGNLFQQQSQAAQLFRQYLQVRYEMHGSAPGREPEQAFQRQEIWEYPLDALREAVVNALVHRDYFNAAMEIMIRVYDDQVVVTSPGSLPEGVTVEELKRERHPSIQRNPLLAQVFYYAQLVEKWGTGTSRMIEICRQQGLPAPEFENTPAWFQVTFSKDPYTEERLRKIGLGERQIKAVLWIKQKGEISNKEYQVLNKVSERTSSRDLSAMVQLGVLDQAGRTGKGTVYLLRGVTKAPMTPQ